MLCLTLKQYTCHISNYFSEAGLQILSVTADGKERGPLRGQISHNGKFGCDVCTLSKIDGIYPPFLGDGKTVRRGEIRTQEFHLQMLSEEYANCTVDERYTCNKSLNFHT